MKYTIVYWYLKILSLLELIYIKDNKLIDLFRNEKMAEIILKTETRKTFGKRNKSLRKNGIIPINMYGLGDSISLQVNEDILYKTLKEVGYTTPLKISIGGKEETYTLVRNISIHPVTDKVIHVDFLRVDLDKPIEAQVPILLINQEDAPGTRGGAGVVTQGVYEVTVLAKPLEIPSELTADCSVLEDLEMYLYSKDLDLPEGAELISDEDAQIAWIQPPRVQVTEEEMAATTEGLEEAEEGDEETQDGDASEENTEEDTST
ncbi:MAG: 50S ribosomal protein L25 [Chloroflexi bacterium]|nr:50S ribosomal protein L25 [Chloroflexota bacterium]